MRYNKPKVKSTPEPDIMSIIRYTKNLPEVDTKTLIKHIKMLPKPYIERLVKSGLCNPEGVILVKSSRIFIDELGKRIVKLQQEIDNQAPMTPGSSKTL